MRRLAIPVLLAAAGLLAGGVSTAASGNQVFELATILSGTFQGSTPGNDLRLDLRPVPTDAQHPYDLFLEVTGKYQGQNVRRQGLVRLELQGKDVYFGYIPHFDATVTSMSVGATRFTDSEANAACGFHFAPRGDGFVGETSGSSCAFALRGATGKWTVELEPGSILLRDAKSGETLRFKRVSKG
ncbi:MAG: hypothetical protein M3R62_00750 [Acidobacteriota bacterium]|nr:hypothetical protein [Acidobacteriota bacterium]MDQ2977719.1 hypothetical protein [Acidobacteriota bacterium]